MSSITAEGSATETYEREIALLNASLAVRKLLLSQVFDGEVKLTANELLSTLLGISLAILSRERLKQGKAAEGNPISPMPPGWVAPMQSELGEFVDEDPERRGVLKDTIFFDKSPEKQQLLHDLVSGLVGSRVDEYDPRSFAIDVATEKIVSQPRFQD